MRNHSLSNLNLCMFSGREEESVLNSQAGLPPGMEAKHYNIPNKSFGRPKPRAGAHQ